MKNLISQLCHDFFNLFFPLRCLACEQPLQFREQHLCLDCQATIPRADFTPYKINPLTEKLKDKIPIEIGTSLFIFTKMSRTQRLIHHIKYKDKQEAAILFGHLLGDEMARVPYYQDFNIVVPVPMHPQKLRLRGYNQAELFAKGLSEKLNIKVESKALVKKRLTETQTRKNRFERLQNTEDVYEVITPSVFEGKNILLVDDVLTTGATLEACALAILEKTENVKLGIATIAFAKNT